MLTLLLLLLTVLLLYYKSIALSVIAEAVARLGAHQPPM